MYTITLQRSSQDREGLTQIQKRIIRKKATNFYVVNGEMMYKKMLIGKNEVCLIGSYNYYICILILYMDVRYIRDRKEQPRIVHACHEDKTSGHLGYIKTLTHITERFMWKDVSKDAKEIVRCAGMHLICYSYSYSYIAYIAMLASYICVICMGLHACICIGAVM